MKIRSGLEGDSMGIGLGLVWVYMEFRLGLGGVQMGCRQDLDEVQIWFRCSSEGTTWGLDWD